MDIKEVNTEGLARALQISIPASDLQTRLDARIDEIKGTVQLKGFRPGKVPAAHIRKTYGTQLMGELIQQTVSESSEEMLKQRDERPAMQPEIKLVGDVDPVMKGEADLVYDISFEIIPPITLADFSKLKLSRPVVEVGDEQINEALERLAASRKSFKARGKTAKARDGDQVKIDFIGRIDGEALRAEPVKALIWSLAPANSFPALRSSLSAPNPVTR